MLEGLLVVVPRLAPPVEVRISRRIGVAAQVHRHAEDGLVALRRAQANLADGRTALRAAVVGFGGQEAVGGRQDPVQRADRDDPEQAEDERKLNARREGRGAQAGLRGGRWRFKAPIFIHQIWVFVKSGGGELCVDLFFIPKWSKVEVSGEKWCYNILTYEVGSCAVSL